MKLTENLGVFNVRYLQIIQVLKLKIGEPRIYVG